MSETIALRYNLHSLAEPSGHEIETSKAIYEWLRATNPDLLIDNVGGHGIIAIYKGKLPGKRIMLRADIDALYIPECGELEYKSRNQGVSHRCGHDGHAAILCGVARILGCQRPSKGEVMLLFQPAEETGEGARAVISDDSFKGLLPDMAFGLHNLPGIEEGAICLRKGCFAAASFGLKISLDGTTAHASQPETGLSPAAAMAQIMTALEIKREQWFSHEPLTTFVITHAELGEHSFGIAPGHAEIWLTLRSFDDKCLKTLYNEVITIVQSHIKGTALRLTQSIHEDFSATTSDDTCVGIVEEAGLKVGIKIIYLESPYRWSEDFGQYSKVCPTAFFGLGSGIGQAPLHDQHYDFPDRIISYGEKIFKSIIDTISQ